MTVRSFKDTLPNGLRVVTVETPHLHSAMVTAYVRVGSRHETKDNNGVSHFLEHLFFRGSHRHPDTVEMNAVVEAVGGNLNGVTSRDCSYFFTPAHPDSLGVVLRVMGDMLTRPRLIKLDVEKRIILEEMLDEVDEDGRDVDLENISKHELWGSHPLGFKIAGTPASVQAMTLGKIKQHYARHYVGGNMVLAIAGPVHHRQVLALARRTFGQLPPGPMATETPAPAVPTGPHLTHVRLPESQTELRLTFPTVSDAHPDFHPLNVMRRILDDGLSSRLPYEVVERRGLAYSVAANLEAFHDTGLFDVEGACMPDAAAAMAAQMCRTLGTLCEGRISDEELQRAKHRHRLHLQFLKDSPGDLVGWFGGTELFRVPESFEARARAVERVSRADVTRVARTYLRRSAMRAVAVGPGTGLKALRRAIERAPGLPG